MYREYEVNTGVLYVTGIFSVKLLRNLTDKEITSSYLLTVGPP